MDVVVGYFAAVHSFAEIRVGGIRRTVTDRFGARHTAVTRFAGAGTSEDTHLEGVAFGMFRFRYFCQFSRNGFGGAGGCKSAQANVVTMFNQAGSLSCRNVIECHICYLEFDVSAMSVVRPFQNDRPDDAPAHFLHRTDVHSRMFLIRRRRKNGGSVGGAA